MDPIAITMAQPESRSLISRSPEPSSPGLVVDPLVDRFDLLYLLRNYWGRLMVAPVLGCIIALFVCSTRQPLYESSALLQIDPSFDTINQFERVGGSDQSDQQALQSLEVTVIADSVILRVIDKLNLREQEGFLPESLAEMPELPDAKLLKYLRENRIFASLLPETRLIEISVLDPKPERARLIAEAFTTEFQEFAAEQRQKEVARARLALQVQSGEARRNALKAEEKLKEFRNSHPGLPVEQDHDLFASRLSRVGAELDSVTLLRRELEGKKQALEGIDPKQSPMEVIEVADQGGSQKVADLLNALTASRARFSAAEAQYGDRHYLYRAAEAEVSRLEKELRELARDIKSSIDARFLSVKEREKILNSELDALVADLSDVKGLSSEFRALQQETEREWKVHQDLQARLGESALSTEVTSEIATVVSEPILPYKEAKPEPLLYVAIGGGLGSLVSGGWLVFAVLAGLPFSDVRQLESRLGLPVLANWTDRRADSAGAGGMAALAQTLRGREPRVTQIVAPGLNGMAEAVAIRVARVGTSDGRRSALLRIKPDLSRSTVYPSGHPRLFIYDVSSADVMNPERFVAGLNDLKESFDNIFVEAGSVGDPELVNFISTCADLDIVVVGRNAIRKQEIEDRIQRLERRGAARTGLVMVDPKAKVN